MGKVYALSPQSATWVETVDVHFVCVSLVELLYMSYTSGNFQPLFSNPLRAPLPTTARADAQEMSVSFANARMKEIVSIITTVTTTIIIMVKHTIIIISTYIIIIINTIIIIIITSPRSCVAKWPLRPLD